MKNYCSDCPDREACHQGMSCDLSRRFAFAANLYQQKMKGNTTVSNTAKNTTATDVKTAGRESNENVDKLISEANLVDNAKKTVPAQGESTDSITEDTTATDGEVDNSKKSAKDRLKALVQKAKNNRQFFLGVATGVVGTSIMAMVMAAKEKVEDVVELTIADEPEPEIEGGSDDETAV